MLLPAGLPSTLQTLYAPYCLYLLLALITLAIYRVYRSRPVRPVMTILGEEWKEASAWHAEPCERLAFSDVPDPDNFLMHVYYLLNLHKDAKVAINMSPKATTFGMIPFGDRMNDILKALPKDEALAKEDFLGELNIRLNKLLHPMVDGDHRYRTDVPDELKMWFERDLDFKDAKTREDAELHLWVSVVRLVSFLHIHGIKPDRYRIYSDEHSRGPNSTITIGIHHPAEVLDYSWDFNYDEERRLKTAHEEAYKPIEGRPYGHRDHKDTVHSDWLRGVVRGICEDYIKRVTRELGIPHPKDIINPMDKLISLNIESKIKAHLLIGGPFTEPLKYVTDIYHRGGEVIGAYAMAAYVKGEVNLFENQFNFFVDMKAAEHFLNFVIEHRIPLTVLPTEAVKESPFSFTVADCTTLRRISPAAEDLIWQYYKRNYNKPKGQDLSPIFDLVTVVVMMHPELLPTRQVEIKLAAPTGRLSKEKHRQPQQFKTHPKTEITWERSEEHLAQERKHAWITMVWPDFEETNKYMAKNRELLMKEVYNTFKRAQIAHGWAHTPKVRDLLGKSSRRESHFHKGSIHNLWVAQHFKSHELEHEDTDEKRLNLFHKRVDGAPQDMQKAKKKSILHWTKAMGSHVPTSHQDKYPIFAAAIKEISDSGFPAAMPTEVRA